MSHTLKLLNPIRHSLSSITYFYSSLQPSYGKLHLIRTWMNQLDPKIHSRCSNFLSKLNLQDLRNLHFSGTTLGLLGVSCIIGYGSLSRQVAYAMDGQDILVDDDRNIFGYSKEGKDTHVLWLFVRKLWLPSFFFLTVLVNWHHPVMLVTKVFLFLISTKPSPLSVYVFVEQLCHQSMRQKPYLYFLKSLYANKVEVQDYKLFCLATVEVTDQKLTLLGVLGGWWALPLSQRAFSVFRDSALY